MPARRCAGVIPLVSTILKANFHANPALAGKNHPACLFPAWAQSCAQFRWITLWMTVPKSIQAADFSMLSQADAYQVTAAYFRCWAAGS
jgi:hypothetical protein